MGAVLYAGEARCGGLSPSLCGNTCRDGWHHGHRRGRHARSYGTDFCRAGTSAYWITYDGRLLPCGMLQEPCASLMNQPFSEAWRSIQEATDQILMPAQCTACQLRPHCEVCAAVCYGENGKFSAVPQYLCEKTKAMLALYQEAEEEV